MKSSQSSIPVEKLKFWYDVYASLPTTGNVEDDLAYATDTELVYRWTSGAWVAVTNPKTLAAANIPNLPATKITSLTFDAARIPRLDKTKLEATANKLLVGAGVGNNLTEIDIPSPALYAGDDVLQASADTERTEAGQTYIKKKEITIGAASTLRIKFDLKNSVGAGGRYAQGRVYKNGAAVGTEMLEDGASYVTYSEDIAGWVKGDLCQLYLLESFSSYTAYCSNFRIYTQFGRVDTD